MTRYAPSFTPVFADTTPGRKLRIGYFGTDLREHAVAHFLMPLLKAHDRSRFDVFVYSAAPTADAVTQALGNAADGFRDVAGFSDNAISQTVRGDRIDILVDVSGHNPGGRSGAILHRPAPVIIGWLGYPATTGLRGVRYRITDSRLDPEGSEAHWTESLLRLEAPSIAYGPPPGPALQPVSRGAGEGVTFVSLAPMTRINEAVLDAWATILKGVPGSTLLFKAAAFSANSTREAVTASLAERGVEASRLAFAGYDRGRNDYLRAIASADIGLDTFPVNGMASTCDALSVGVPVVTMAGAAHAGRLGMAILTAVGCEELVASSVDDYVKIATGLAKDPQRVAKYRAALPRQLAESPLCDGASLARRLEAAFERLWAEESSGVYYAAPEGGIQPDIPPTAVAERSAPVAPELPTINASDLV
jgi:predicted O-linked N-acetylglucosamine transferase (SPINDLY family)